MIKAIIFDCFGVLSSEGWQNFKQIFFSDKPDALAEAKKIRTLADKGHYTHDEVISLFADLANISVEVVKKEIEDYQPNTYLLNYIKDTLKAHYKIGMLSNVSDDWLFSIFSAEQLEMFEVKALSYRIGYAKPDPEAYRIVAEKLQVDQSECLFVDDLEHNVFAATQVGMKAVRYQDYQQAVDDIETILAADSDK